MGCSNSQAAVTIEKKEPEPRENEKPDKPVSFYNEPEIVEEEKPDYLTLIGPEPEKFSRERIHFPGDENTLLQMAGLEMLTEEQLHKIKPHWMDRVRFIAETTS